MPVRIQILLTILLLASTYAKVQLIFKKEVSLDSVYLDVSGDGNCIAFTNYLSDKKTTTNSTFDAESTQRRTSNITVYKNNGNLVWNHQNDYDFFRQVSFGYSYGIKLYQQKMLALNYDCSALYFQQQSSFSEVKFSTRQISTIEPMNIMFGGINNTYALAYYYGGGYSSSYSGIQLKVYERQILRTLPLNSTFSFQSGLFKMQMSKDTKTISFFSLAPSSSIFITEINVITMNATYSYIALNEHFQANQHKLCLIDSKQYLFFQTYNYQNTRKYSKLVYQKNQTSLEFDTWFEPSSFIFISGNKKVVAILQKVNPGKNVIYLSEVEKLIESGIKRKSVLKNITINYQNQILEIKLNYNGDKITYMHRPSPFKNQIIQLKIDLTGSHVNDDQKNLQVDEQPQNKDSHLDTIQIDQTTIDDISLDGSQKSKLTDKSRMDSSQQEYTFSLKDILTFAITFSFLTACSIGFCLYCCLKSLKRLWKSKFQPNLVQEIEQKSTEVSKGPVEGKKYREEDLDQV